LTGFQPLNEYKVMSGLNLHFYASYVRSGSKRNFAVSAKKGTLYVIAGCVVDHLGR